MSGASIISSFSSFGGKYGTLLMQEEHFANPTLIFLEVWLQHQVSCCSNKIRNPTKMHPQMYKIT